MTEENRNFLEGEVAPEIRQLSIPLIWGLFSLTVFSVVDTWFIGRLGTTYLAAFGFTIPVILLFMSVIWGLCIGTTSAISRVYGTGDTAKMRQMSTDAMSLTLVLTVLSSVIGYAIIDKLFHMMGAKQDLLPLIDDFMSIWYLGLPFLGVQMVGNACIRATGDTKFPASMMLVTTVITIVLDPFLIYGWAGLPRMELSGAALTLLIAYVLTFVISVYKLAYEKKILSPRVFHAGIFASWKSVLHVGIPSIVSGLIVPISTSVITWMAASFGKEAVAAMGVATRVEGMLTIFFYALGAGISIFAGQNFGAGNFGRVKQAARIGAGYSIIMGVISAIILFAFNTQIAELFDSNPLVIHYAAAYMRWVPASYCALGVMVICNSIFNATGKPIPSTAIIFLKSFVLYVPLAYFLQARMGFTGILMALLITNFVTGIVAFVWNKKAIS